MNGCAGGVAIPAPIIRAAVWCAMAVLITGTVPLRTTFRMSMPVGVPSPLSGASGKSGLVPAQISAMWRDVATPSANDFAPTIFWTAGDAAMAMPPRP